MSFGELNGVPVVFMARHGYGHTIAPQDINYRANIAALKQAGADCDHLGRHRRRHPRAISVPGRSPCPTS